MTCECLRDEMAGTYKNKKSEYPGQKVLELRKKRRTLSSQQMNLKSAYLGIRRYIRSPECFNALKLPLIKQPTLRKQCHMIRNCFKIPWHIPLLIWNSPQQKYNQQTHIYQHSIEIICPYIYPSILNIEHIRSPSCCKACKE